jgi:hypothetical protein
MENRWVQLHWPEQLAAAPMKKAKPAVELRPVRLELLEPQLL